jgi:hypothetical protein
MRGMTIPRSLRNRRTVVAIGAVIAVAAVMFAIIGLPRSAGPPAANAEAQVFLDTRDSQLVTAGSKGVTTLPIRATLVADLLGSDRYRALLADEAHVLPGQLEVLPPSSLDLPAVLSPLVTKAAPLFTAATEPYIVLLGTNEETAASPTQVISIATEAPTQAAAFRLANATIATLKSILAPRQDSTGTFIVKTVVPPRSVVIHHRSRRAAYAVAGGLLIFLAWYAATLLGFRLARRRRLPQLGSSRPGSRRRDTTIKRLLKGLPVVPSAVAASLLIAVVCAICSVSTVSLVPPKIAPSDLETAGATTSVLLDTPQSVITAKKPDWVFSLHSVIARAGLLSRLMATTPVVSYIGRDAGIPPDQIAAVAPITGSFPSELTDAGSEQRARELLLAGDRYRLEIQARQDAPVIDVYAQAPSPAQAERLANAAITGLRAYLRNFAVDAGVDPASQVRLEQLGEARGGVINSGAKLEIAALTFVFAFMLSLVALLILARGVRGRGRPGPEPPDARARTQIPHLTEPLALATTRSRRSRAAGRPLGLGSLEPVRARTSRFESAARAIPARAADWPRTTRVLPWMLAAFITVLWLVPFDSITLRMSLPIDPKFDRLVLPILIVTWLLSMVKGKPDAPRLRVTKIHVAVGIFVALAFLSVVVNASSLNRTLELGTSIKQLPLLVTYLSVFLIAASVVRRPEVGAFLTYTIVLATICALGMILEYKTQYNIFFSLSRKLLPGSIFSVAPDDSGYGGGRVLTHGPTAHGLAAASMLSMAFAITITRIMHVRRTRERIIYTLVAATLMVGILATQKKTGLIAPAAAVLAIGCFRRRELLKMAPIAILLTIAVLIVSPGTIVPVITQLAPNQLGANAPSTTSDRAARYDAIRPDVWTHLALGRGFGSYQPLGHRVLDSEILVRLIEMGVLGLAAYFWLGGSVIATARKTINARHPVRSPQALAGVAAAAVFLVVGALFDSLSFPQVPYIFLYLAALTAVVVKPPNEPSSPMPSDPIEGLAAREFDHWPGSGSAQRRRVRMPVQARLSRPDRDAPGTWPPRRRA